MSHPWVRTAGAKHLFSPVHVLTTTNPELTWVQQTEPGEPRQLASEVHQPLYNWSLFTHPCGQKAARGSHSSLELQTHELRRNRLVSHQSCSFSGPQGARPKLRAEPNLCLCLWKTRTMLILVYRHVLDEKKKKTYSAELLLQKGHFWLNPSDRNLWLAKYLMYVHFNETLRQSSLPI